MKGGNYMILFLADVHLGVKLPNEDFYNSLIVSLETFKKQAIIHNETCELIVVCGDLFDHALNVYEMTFASSFILKLYYNGCGVNGTHVPVHIIEGTYSHDRNQFNIFANFTNKSDAYDERILYFKNWIRITLPSGKRLLYLPQEYGDVDYTEAFNETYDLICGHGPMSSQTKNVVTSHGTEIMHSVETLSSISKLCVFGHYHEYTDFGNGVYYAGSMLRFRYGEDETKYIVMCDDNFNLIKVKNPVAKEFKTIEIHNPEELRDALSNDITTPHRFVINPTDIPDLMTYHAIMDIAKQNENVKFKVTPLENITDVTLPTVDDETTDQPSTVTEPIVGLIDFINQKYKVDLSEEIHSYESKIKRDEK
jgi:DNA repair exonuclease SbcCD nuclease subunit